MEILVDTREQPSDRAVKRVKQFNCPYQRAKLEYGDYTFNFTLPNGKKFFDLNGKIYPLAMIERKMNLEELSGCFTEKPSSIVRDFNEKYCLNLRNRFELEFYKAKVSNSKIYLLIEDGNWEKLINGKYNTKFGKEAFFASLCSWQARYNLQIIFCQNQISGKLIKQILYRELKERLEGGVFG